MKSLFKAYMRMFRGSAKYGEEIMPFYCQHHGILTAEGTETAKKLFGSPERFVI